jgi:signal transduction histidine kinase
MSRFWHLLRLDRITVQIALVILLGGIASSTMVGLLVARTLPERGPPPHPSRVTAELGTIARLMESLPREERPLMAALHGRWNIGVTLEGTHSPSPQTSLPVFFARELPSGVTAVAAVPEGRFDEAFLVRLSDGQSVFLQAFVRRPPMLLSPLGLGMIVLGILMVTVSIWVTLRIVAPMGRFAAAVEQFGLRGEGDALPERGTAEVRKATSAFNLMRERIQRLIEDRTRTVIAISHDLRTPLTRLRLRAEQVTEPELKQGMLRDMDVMETSIAGALSYLREGGVPEAFELVDLPSLVETICDRFADAGFAVSHRMPQRLAVLARPQAISRAITNLVENGTKYASSVVVRLDVQAPGWAEIVVEDDGPGIPDEEKKAVLQPFYRAAAARESSGGFGLGLAIAAEVARLHGGSLTLYDRAPNGLRVCFRLPLGNLTIGQERPIADLPLAK